MRLSDDLSVDLEHCAIAVFDDPDDLAAATGELEKLGYDYLVLEGQSGQETLQPKPEGLTATLQRLAAAFGDELRVIDRLDRSLADGGRVMIVKADERQAEVSDLLTEKGGRFLWQFRGWTFNSAGDGTGDGAPVAEEDGS